MNKINWEVHGIYAQGNNPPFPQWEATIGTDPNGHTWLCRVSPYIPGGLKRFNVDFDIDEVNEDGSPFLRDSVVNADSYWKARRDIYHMVECDYKNIQDVVEKFIIKMKIK